jgi:hypothetical protein
MSDHSRRVFLRRAAASGAAAALTGVGPTSLGKVWAADSSPALRWARTEPANKPIGQPQGIFPGRVVWVHNPQVVRWDGNETSGGWFEDRFTDPVLADQMLSQSLCRLTGASREADAWIALFRHSNQLRGRRDAGYQPGEKVAVKLNLNCCKDQAELTQGLYNTPQLSLALLRQLVQEAGVRPADIVVYDASRSVHDSIFVPAHRQFPDIRFEDRGGGQGRFPIQPDKAVTLHFGDPNTPDSGQTYLPSCVTGATYMINAALLKGHSLAGVTLCAKNHFGSVYRENTGRQDPHQGWNPSHLHPSITVRKRPMGTYNALVDLMGHKDLGGKTVLYLIDALYASPHQSVRPERWQSAPFDDHWTASVLVSQDPVAIESVAVDFFAAEKTADRMIGQVDNYLHEAALAHQPPSEICYAPARDGLRLASLGVHEHWNHPDKKQYSRNLGSGPGIELVMGD